MKHILNMTQVKYRTEPNYDLSEIYNDMIVNVQLFMNGKIMFPMIRIQFFLLPFIDFYNEIVMFSQKNISLFSYVKWLIEVLGINMTS